MDEWFAFVYTSTAGERCDVALTLQLRALPEFAELSRARVQALIDAGGVTYDGKQVPRGQKNLRPRMRVEANLTLLRQLLQPAAPAELLPADIPLDIVYLDERLAVVNKPAGLTVHPAPTEEGPTLSAALLHHLGRLSDHAGADRPGIVHRLDKETSGLLVVARDNPAHVALAGQFARRLVDKEYVALCIDPPQPEHGLIDAPIERHPYDRQKMWARGGGRSAATEYRTAASWGPLTLIELAIHSGRTHQIRVHLQTVGSSILNDMKYGEGRNAALRRFLGGRDDQARREWRQAWPQQQTRTALLALLADYPGIFLHARRLAFAHPADGRRLEFDQPPPAAWEELRRLATGAAEP